MLINQHLLPFFSQISFSNEFHHSLLKKKEAGPYHKELVHHSHYFLCSNCLQCKWKFDNIICLCISMAMRNSLLIFVHFFTLKMKPATQSLFLWHIIFIFSLLFCRKARSFTSNFVFKYQISLHLIVFFPLLSPFFAFTRFECTSLTQNNCFVRNSSILATVSCFKKID